MEGRRLDDQELVRLSKAGDLAAYEALVRAHTAVAHRAAVVLAGPADAEDIVQEAFVKAYRALGRFREESAFRPWLLRIVTNEAHNARRAAGRRTALADRSHRLATVPTTSESAEETTLQAQSRAALLRAVDALPERLRTVVVCRYLLDLTEAETCEVLGLRKGTAKSRLSRGLAKLREGVVDGG
jgi:RNA polymerase sigma factor (sigma-70 family)